MFVFYQGLFVWIFSILMKWINFCKCIWIFWVSEFKYLRLILQNDGEINDATHRMYHTSWVVKTEKDIKSYLWTKHTYQAQTKVLSYYYYMTNYILCEWMLDFEGTREKNWTRSRRNKYVKIENRLKRFGHIKRRPLKLWWGE